MASAGESVMATPLADFLPEYVSYWPTVIKGKSRILIENRQNETGVMMHLVTEVLDEGPPITYCKFPIKDRKFDGLWEDLDNKLKTKSLKEIIKEEGENNPLFKEIRIQGVIRELPLLLQTLKEFADGKIDIKNQNVVVDGKNIKGGFDLSLEIDEII